MTVVSAPAPSLWLRLTVLAVLVWPLFMGLVRRRGGDLRLFVVLPHFFAAAGVSIGLVRVIRAIALTGRAPHATAAGLAEAFVAPSVGAFMSGLLGLVLVLRQRFYGHALTRFAFAPVLFALATVVQGVMGVLGLYVFRQPGYSEHLQQTVQLLALFNLAALLVALVATFVRAPSTQSSQRWWFIGAALFGFAAAYVFFVFVQHLRAYAIGGA